ncbi:MAG: zinc ABC transporter substrate-binding protein [Spirochaetes bacterium]|nr:zinc ABC transporter substrate-binding protein [Spirochaetota bacterium]
MKSSRETLTKMIPPATGSGVTGGPALRRRPAVRLWILTAAAAAVILSCSPEGDGRQTIAVSILPQRYLLERIAGDRFHIAVMIPAGYSPESSEVTPGQMKEIARAVIYFRVGPIPFERSRMAGFIQANPAMIVTDTSRGIPLIEGDGSHHGGADPHVWVSPKSGRIMARHMMETLIAFDPGSRKLYERNFRALAADIDRLDRRLAETLRPCRGGRFIVYHPAWAYLARDYGLVQVPVEHQGKSPAPSRIGDIIRLARSEGIRTVFVQRQSPTDTAEAIAGDIGGTLVTLDPLSPDWPGEMERAAAAIAKSAR